jgi:hypothetical protein
MGPTHFRFSETRPSERPEGERHLPIALGNIVKDNNRPVTFFHWELTVLPSARFNTIRAQVVFVGARKAIIEMYQLLDNAERYYHLLPYHTTRFIRPEQDVFRICKNKSKR